MLNENVLLTTLKNNFDNVLDRVDEKIDNALPCYKKETEILKIPLADILAMPEVLLINVDTINLSVGEDYILSFCGYTLRATCFKNEETGTPSLDYVDNKIRLYILDKYVYDYNSSSNIADETKAVVSFEYLDKAPTTDLILKKVVEKKIDADLLPSPIDLVVENSISIGRESGSNIGEGSTAIGAYTKATNSYSHAEGDSTTANAYASHAEGIGTTTSGDASHAEGKYTNALGTCSHAEGNITTASGECSHTEGYSSYNATSYFSNILDETNDTILSKWNSKKFSLAKGEASHVEGANCLALGIRSHAEGQNTVAYEPIAHSEGNETTAKGFASHSEGECTYATGQGSHAEGYYTAASGTGSHAEGRSTNKASDYYTDPYLSNNDNIIEKWNTNKFSLAKSEASHVEGQDCLALGTSSHAEGYETIAYAYRSHAEGSNTIAKGNYQHVQGKYNIEDTKNKFAHIVGNGTAVDARSNAHTLDWDGNAWYSGNVYIGDDKKELATKEYVDEVKEAASKANGLKDAIFLKDQITGESYLLQIRNGILVTSIMPNEIRLKTNPTKTSYYAGDGFEIDGIELELVSNDGSTSIVEDIENISVIPEFMEEGTTSVTVNYNYYGFELSVDVPVTVSAFDPKVVLVDFIYTDNGDGTYTITDWKQTLNGVSSTELVIPNNNKIIL